MCQPRIVDGCRWCLLLLAMVETTRLVLVVKPLVVAGTTRLPPTYPALTIFGPLELPGKWQQSDLEKLYFSSYDILIILI